MAKPRTRLTRLKHFGTILWHPQQYYRYKRYKAEFIQENHLGLRAPYAGEVVPPHPYPGAVGATVRETGVIYPPVGGDPATVIAPGTDLMAAALHDHQAAAGVAPADLGHYRQNLVVLRQEAGGAAPVLRSAVKRHVHTSAAPALQNVGRTQHSTLSGGAPVAAAALRMDATPAQPAHILMSSGHYQPDHEAAVKLAIAGKMAGSLNRRQTEFRAPLHGGGTASENLTMKERMRVVSNWARHR